MSTPTPKTYARTASLPVNLRTRTPSVVASACVTIVMRRSPARWPATSITAPRRSRRNHELGPRSAPPPPAGRQHKNPPRPDPGKTTTPAQDGRLQAELRIQTEESEQQVE